jgi:hypothetical protein
VIIDRVEHPGELSNAHLLAAGPDGHGILVDSNGIVEPVGFASRLAGSRELLVDPRVRLSLLESAHERDLN